MSERRYGVDEICRAMDTPEREERYATLVKEAIVRSYGLTCDDCHTWTTLCLCDDDTAGTLLAARVDYIRNGEG